MEDTHIDMIPGDLRSKYAEAGQEHIFAWADKDKLSPEELKTLVTQLRRVDPVAATNAYIDSVKNALNSKKVANLMPLNAAPVYRSHMALAPEEASSWENIGLSEIAKGKTAILILGGGQATRLRCTTCKGDFEAGWPSHEPLYQLFVERILRLKYLAAQSCATPTDPKHIRIPICIMTSPATDAVTKDFFRRNKYFGLPEEDIIMFCQNVVPCFDMHGKILMESKFKIAESPDGNGGIFDALHKGGVFKILRESGVEHLQVFPVDNAATRVADPRFIGYCISQGVCIGIKVVRKQEPDEKVGMFALEKSDEAASPYRCRAIEYSELPAELASATDSKSGRLLFDAGNTCIHWFRLNVLEHFAGIPQPAGTWLADTSPNWKTYHQALKAIPLVDEATGETIPMAKLKGNTGVKLETFMFDTFPLVPVEKIGILEVSRMEEFAPIKNACGAKCDTPETALGILCQLHRSWLEKAGATVETGPDGDTRVEISPMVSYGGEGLESLAGMVFTTPVLILPKMDGAMDHFIAKSLSVKTGHAIHITPIVQVFYL